ncbi:hypothetical protein OSB04_019613 [Centaurea solstitialis]|uniref:CCHC-type domain-containing protein n=1 Tax=Centaurea solstitialis TaxID=347529 RepID=A0AA38WCJ7_9ASTR|nr:hypothetical protein OSB04_019613 [Centaurea solstitialis]
MVQTRNNPSGSEAEQTDQLAAQITTILQQTLPGLFDQMREELVQTLDQRIDAALTARSSGSGSTAQSQSRVVTYKDFMTCKPPFFEGQKDPVACYRWYSAVEGAFRTSGCPAGSKVLFAVNLLRNAAKDWWDLILRRFSEAQITALTWEEFKVMFDEEFAPSIERERIAAEFLNLTQTTETVNEITAKFLEKLLFVPGYANDESLKMARYLGVLKTEIKGAVTTKRCKTFSDMVETARAQEIHLEEKRQGKRKADDQSGPVKKHKGVKSDSKSEPAACSKCGRNHRGECRAHELSCYKCGKPGHFSHECKETVKTCFHCYQPGHIKPNCPQLKGAPVQAPAPATLRITDGTTTGKSGPITRGRAFQMTAEEAQAALDAITEISFLLAPKSALVLFDTGATWSYVSHKFCKDFQIELGKLDRPVIIGVAEEKLKCSGSTGGVPSGPESRKLRCESITRSFSPIDFGNEIPRWLTPLPLSTIPPATVGRLVAVYVAAVGVVLIGRRWWSSTAAAAAVLVGLNRPAVVSFTLAAAGSVESNGGGGGGPHRCR